MRGVLLLVLFALGCTPAHSVYIPRDPELQREPLYFYPPIPRSAHPKAGVFFLGNDLGFWEPHQKLAERLASHGYAVVGFDVKKFLDQLPDSALLRDSILVHDIPRLMKRSLHELGADSAPIIIATLGPYTSASISPTRLPLACIARARLTATVDLPTPPLPLATATTCCTPGIVRLPV